MLILAFFNTRVPVVGNPTVESTSIIVDPVDTFDTDFVNG